ncbi:MAG: hypothetical protein IRY91_16095, partial [Gemmatimonadaceae bacterium]|nr:hypothetical protein [Gemmatimonadaceae bacterium]
MRRLAIGGVGLALLAALPGAAGVPRALHTNDAPAPRATPLRDPALTVGTLPNGMRYYLRRNTSPKHRVELRLV